MRAAFNAVAILAIAHLLFVIAGVGWVMGTGRMDERRWSELTGMLGETTADRDRREAEQAAAIEAERQRAAADLAEIPLTAEQQIDRKLALSEADRQVIQRMRREVDDLRRSLRAERDLLDEERAAFLADKGAFEAEREKVLRTEGEEQFQQVLATLKTMKADLAHDLLATTIDQQPDGEDVVTAYLDNLPPRNRAKILDEFNADDPDLAARLLERLRTRGVIASADGPR